MPPPNRPRRRSPSAVVAVVGALGMLAAAPAVSQPADPYPDRLPPAGAAAAATASAPDVAVVLPDVLVDPTPGPTVSLPDALVLARARHPQLASIRVELEKADAMLRQAWGALLPRLSAQLMYTVNDEPTVVDLGAGVPGVSIPMDPIVIRQQHIVQSQLQLQVPLFAMPIYSAIETAQIGRRMAGLGEEEAARQLLLGVATAYYGALSARELIEVQRDAFEKAQKRLVAARARLSAGAGIAIDVARADLEVESARMAHEAALLGFDNARQALAGLLVMDDLPMPVDPQEDFSAPSSADEQVERAGGERADVELRRLAVEMAEQNLWTAWTQFFPTLGLAWQLNSELGELGGFGSRRNAWALVFVLSIPIYDQPRYGLLDQRRAEVRQAEIQTETALLGMETEIRSAHRQWQSSLTLIATAQRQVSLAEEALRLAEAGFLAGAGTSLDVDDAQQRVNQARINVAVQRYQSRLALLKLAFLAGEVPGGE